MAINESVLNDIALDDIGGSGGGGRRPQPITQTTVTLDQRTNMYGSTNVVSGELVGNKGRTVILEATPLPGYVFSRWEISTIPISLVWVADVVNQTFSSLEDACANVERSTAKLYTDGVRLFWDQLGNQEIDPGWYKSSSTFINYSYDNKITTTTTCPSTRTGGGGTGRDIGGQRTM